MRIDTTIRSTGISGRAAAGKAGSAPAFVPAGMGGAARASAATPAMPMAGLDAILALQTVGDFRESRRRSVKRGASMLDALESIKADLLVGNVSADRLDALVGQLASMREHGEPDLDAVIDDIELRVRVELAKFGRFPPL